MIKTSGRVNAYLLRQGRTMTRFHDFRRVLTCAARPNPKPHATKGFHPYDADHR